MKISILRSISAENDDKRSMKITQIGEYLLYMSRNMHDSTYLIFVHHEGEPIQVFYSTKKMQLSRFIIQIYKRHFNRFINIFKHCWLRSRATLKRPPYCVHKYFMPQHVLSRNFRKNQNSGWLIDILQCNLWAS